MMEASISIKPFGFDRVFNFGADSNEKPPSRDEEELRAQVAALQERIEEMRREREQAVEQARLDAAADALSRAREERGEAMLSATDALHAALEELSERVSGIAERIECDAAQVALAAAEQLAGHAIAQSPSRAIDEALGRALKQVTRGTALHVRVHPANLDEMEALVAARRAGERRALSITVAADDDIAPNDAHIGWAEGGLVVDAAERRAAIVRELSGLIEPGE